jgi:lipopolysaccharide assembly protein A
MRAVHIGVIVTFVAVIAIFALQNLESVTMSFLGFRISAPLAVVAVVVTCWVWLPAAACGR